MSDATPISMVVILLVLSVFIIIANIVTVFVFWIHRHKLKRTFLIVFNLTVADLFYQSSCAPKLAKSIRLNIARDLVKQLTGQRTASK